MIVVQRVETCFVLITSARSHAIQSDIRGGCEVITTTGVRIHPPYVHSGRGREREAWMGAISSSYTTHWTRGPNVWAFMLAIHNTSQMEFVGTTSDTTRQREWRSSFTNPLHLAYTMKQIFTGGCENDCNSRQILNEGKLPRSKDVADASTTVVSR